MGLQPIQSACLPIDIPFIFGLIISLFFSHVVSLCSLCSFVAEDVFFDLKLIAAEVDQQAMLLARRFEVAENGSISIL